MKLTATQGAEVETTEQQAEEMALEAESRIQDAATQEDREFWIRVADYWWNKA